MIDPNPSFAIETFAANQEQVRWFGERIMAALPPGDVSILDVGCGDGSLVVYLAERLPHATLTGVDLSAPNVEAAAGNIERHGLGTRVSISRSDFLKLDAPPVDALVAHSSLQFMPVAVDDLASAVHRHVRPGGLVIHATPIACAFNTALSTTRRLLRTVRSPLVDSLLLGTARLLHPGATEARRRQALEYMYRPLVHTEDAIRRALVARGFAAIMDEPMPHSSWGQPKHRLAVLASPR